MHINAWNSTCWGVRTPEDSYANSYIDIANAVLPGVLLIMLKIIIIHVNNVVVCTHDSCNACCSSMLSLHWFRTSILMAPKQKPLSDLGVVARKSNG